ncbi:MAG: hypothetical protein RI973_1456 [Bacteroidota bacterium]|jgi:hypothetical protein
MKKTILILSWLTLLSAQAAAQAKNNAFIRDLVSRCKQEIRGPYKDIRWFCHDGSFAVPRQQSCPEPGGVQRARYRDEVVALAASNHVFLGQILSTTPKEDFWDARNYQSRLKQYQLEKYLQSIDDGWILRRARYYRGARQIEDEEAWGIDFLSWLLGQDEVVRQHYFLLRQAARDIPHQGDDNNTQQLRALSKLIAEQYSPFNDLRVKLHGQPESSDLGRVYAFREQHRAKLSPALLGQLGELIAGLEKMYQPVNLSALGKYARQLPGDSELARLVAQYLQTFGQAQPEQARAIATAELLWKIRLEFTGIKGSKARLAMLDLSCALEELFFRDVAAWRVTDLSGLMNKICYTGMAAAGTGLLEIWEWQAVEGAMAVPQTETVDIAELHDRLARSRSLVAWGSGMVSAVYRETVAQFNGFEPLAAGFTDDRIRSSVLLSLGQSISQLGDLVTRESGWTNQVLDMPGQGQIQGLNPGYALGELVVAGGNGAGLTFSKDKIYLFNRPPADLKPVAGIATVTEGNLVSHVQLLARNLGIPNAVITAGQLESLRRYNGRQVFFAVSGNGTVIMKLAENMSPAEKSLLEVKKRKEERIAVPLEKMDLYQRSILDLREVNASLSGKVCGPKAANLGQLKQLFPEQVTEGLVIPFGIFRQHLDQTMPGKKISYWAFLTGIFKKAQDMEAAGQPAAEVERYILGELAVLREAIQRINLMPDFVAGLKRGFYHTFGKELGKVPVFLRSDTNMEDLKDFTGAGLNLTVFNVLKEEKIWQGIRDVWASPYTERSYKWRQNYLLNPENVFPSLLVIPSVDVDYSGVLITTGLGGGGQDDMTAAFSRGAGGAVEGQAAETYLLRSDGSNYLLSPAREPLYRRLPAEGGTEARHAAFDHFLLTQGDIYQLRLLARDLYQNYPDMQPPFDVECGFKDGKLWLFQVRPFVENKQARSSEYLKQISKEVPGGKAVPLNSRL